MYGTGSECSLTQQQQNFKNIHNLYHFTILFALYRYLAAAVPNTIIYWCIDIHLWLLLFPPLPDVVYLETLSISTLAWSIYYRNIDKIVTLQ